QIQSSPWSAALDLHFHLIKVLRSKRPAQPNPRSALPGSQFNLQSHVPLVRKHTVAKCNNGAIHNSLHGHDLEVPAILNFEEFLFGEENAADWQVAALESASLWNFKPIFVDSEALDF